MRKEAELAWYRLAGQHTALLQLDSYAPMERIAVLAGFAPRGMSGFTPVQRRCGELLRKATPAIPDQWMQSLGRYSDRMVSALQHGDDGRLFVQKPVIARAKHDPSGTPPRVKQVSAATEMWPAFFWSAAGRLCEALMPALTEGFANQQAPEEGRSACMRAACGVLWVLDHWHYAGGESPLLVRRLLEDLELSPVDEHYALLDAVRAGCDEQMLLELLPPPTGEAKRWRFSRDYRACQWGEERFLFTDTQSAILRVLDQARLETGLGLGVDELLKQSEIGELPVDVKIGGFVRHYFRDRKAEDGMHPCWNRMLKQDRKGYFELIPPPESSHVEPEPQQ